MVTDDGTNAVLWRAEIFYLFIINSGIEFNTSIAQIQGSQQQQYKPEKERKGYK